MLGFCQSKIDLRCCVVLLVLNYRELFWLQHVFWVLMLVLIAELLGAWDMPQQWALGLELPHSLHTYQLRSPNSSEDC